jgi:hypothetical protein
VFKPIRMNDTPFAIGVTNANGNDGVRCILVEVEGNGHYSHALSSKEPRAHSARKSDTSRKEGRQRKAVMSFVTFVRKCDELLSVSQATIAKNHRAANSCRAEKIDTDGDSFASGGFPHSHNLEQPYYWTNTGTYRVKDARPQKAALPPPEHRKVASEPPLPCRKAFGFPLALSSVLTLRPQNAATAIT